MEQVWKVWDNKCIPLRSLGKLQSMVVKLSGIQNSIKPEIHKKAVIVMAADNGIIEEDVDKCIRNLTAIGRDGMNETDRLVLRIMTNKC